MLKGFSAPAEPKDSVWDSCVLKSSQAPPAPASGLSLLMFGPHESFCRAPHITMPFLQSWDIVGSG